MSHVWDDVIDKGAELSTLLLGIAASVPHDHTGIAQIFQASEVIDNLRPGSGASLSAAIHSSPGLPNAEKELMAQAEIGHTPPVRLTQLPERA
jgi:hypothetical protein